MKTLWKVLIMTWWKYLVKVVYMFSYLNREVGDPVTILLDTLNASNVTMALSGRKRGLR